MGLLLLLASDSVTTADDVSDDPAFSEWGIRKPVAPRNNSCVARGPIQCRNFGLNNSFPTFRKTRWKPI